MKIQLYKTAYIYIVLNGKLIFLCFFSLFMVKSLLCCRSGKLLIKFLLRKSLQKRYIFLDIKNCSYEEFLQWFVGFTDAEGNFSIGTIWNKDKTKCKRIFIFKIALHIDDMGVL